MDNPKTRVALLSVLSNTTLVALKVTVGVAIGSVSVLSEAIHSAVDLVAAVIAFVAVRAASKPADEEHPFGHGKFETASGLFEALLIFVAGCWILYEATDKLHHPARLEAAGWGFIVMLVSACANLAVSQRLFQVGRETDSLALLADAWHLRTDVYTSAGVMAGLGAIGVGGRLAPTLNLAWLDPVAAMIVAVLILHASVELSRQAARDIFDTSLDAAEIDLITAQIRSVGSKVHSFHQLKTRKSGPDRQVQFHLLVDPTLSLGDAHRLRREVKARIQRELPSAHVTIQLEPCELECTPECTANGPLEGAAAPAKD